MKFLMFIINNENGETLYTLQAMIIKIKQFQNEVLNFYHK